jgi:ATP-dependent DNA helicase RecQ
MRNQTEAATRVGVRAATLNSANQDDWPAIRSSFVSDALDLLIISLERLANDEFLTDCLGPVAQRMGMLVVDEAHCISEWGHDFRPAYRRIGRILKVLPANIPVLATTATASDRVVADVRGQLGQNVELQRGPLMRASLSLHALSLGDRAARMAWLAEHLGQLPGGGIIYTLTTRDADRLAAWLRREGHDLRSYHAGIDQAERVTREDALLGNQMKALVATSRSAWGSTNPTWVSWSTSRPRGPWSTITSRSAGPGGRPIMRSAS